MGDVCRFGLFLYQGSYFQQHGGTLGENLIGCIDLMVRTYVSFILLHTQSALFLRQVYAKDETFSVVPWFVGPPGFYTSSLEVARQVAGSGRKSDFIKPEYASEGFLCEF